MFTSDRLILRPVNRDDIEFMRRITTEPEVLRWLPGMITDEEMLLGWLDAVRPEDHEYLIILKESGGPIGECSLTVERTGSIGEIGYMLLPEYWGHGYGTETARILMQQAESMGLMKVTATTHTKNTASVRILEKLGFREESVGWMLFDVEDALNENRMIGYACDLHHNAMC